VDSNQSINIEASPHLERFARMNHYEVLDVPRDASVEMIVQAYRMALNSLEPSSVAIYSIIGPREAAAMTTMIELAYKILRDPMERRRYDRMIENIEKGIPADEKGDLNLPDDGMIPDTLQKSFPFFAPVYSIEQVSAPSNSQKAIIEHQAADKPSDIEPQIQTVVTEFPSIMKHEVEENIWADSGASSQVEPVEIPKSPDAAPIETPREIIKTSKTAVMNESSTTEQSNVKSEDTGNAELNTQSFPEADLSSESGVSRELPPLENKDKKPAESEGPVYSGQFIRLIRESHGLTLDDIASITRITKINLINIENENFKEFPALVYVRGYLMQYTRCLKLDPKKAASSYIQRMQELSDQTGEKK